MRQTMQSLYLTAVISVLAFASGCASPQVLPAQAHPPTVPDAVNLYQKQPAKYEKLGVVETTENLKWQNGDDVTPAVDALKAEAAAMGANGLLLSVDTAANEKQTFAGGSYRGKMYHFPVQSKPVKKAMATAIYVVEQ